MPGETRNRFSVTTSAKAPERARDPLTDIGHYFEQSVLERHSRLQAARTLTVALNEELDELGVAVDPATGAVTVRRA